MFLDLISFAQTFSSYFNLLTGTEGRTKVSDNMSLVFHTIIVCLSVYLVTLSYF